MAVAALVLGILTYVCLGPIAAVLAIVFGIMGMKKAKEVGTGRGMSIAGIVLGAVGLLATVVVIVLLFALGDTISDSLGTADPDDYELTSETCSVDAFGSVDFDGSIENTANQDLRFTLEAEFTDGSGKVLDTVDTVVFVSEGRTTSWSITGDVGDATDVSCQIVHVNDLFNFD